MNLERDLSLPRIRELKASSHLRMAALAALQTVSDSLPELSFQRIYFGAEFCEHLIPSRDELLCLLEATAARDLKVTLLTPYVSNAGLRKLHPLFEALQQHGNHEVVFSDWGVLSLLRREFPGLIPVQGRLLNKSLRDPRIASAFTQLPSTAAGPAAALEAAQSSNLNTASYIEFLLQHGVRMVELDNAPQGTDVSCAAHGIAVSMVFPFGIVTTGRVCMAAGLGYPKSEKFRPGAGCYRECQTHQATFSFSDLLLKEQKKQIYVCGNSFFYLQSPELLRRLIEQVRSGAITRLVYQPRLPMLHGAATTKTAQQGAIAWA